MSEQLSLPILSDGETWTEMLEEIRGLCRVRTHKEVSYALKISAPDLSNALAERQRSYLRMEHLPTLLTMRLDDKLPLIIAGHCGLELAAPRAPTAAEKLERLESAVARAGVAGAAILADAYGRRR